MTPDQQHAERLRSRARAVRAVAYVPTNGGHETDRPLREIAERLECEADEVERGAT